MIVIKKLITVSIQEERNYISDTQGIAYAMEKSEQICNMAQDIINTKRFNTL